ncbi:MAG: tRNA (adenosine(37)-N6)-dimethylallyltransferase MiaA, partial [Bifidobacteriaceae bacterium]|nr:tRNA (adenosine(37)-N6)-dimethylallyltransferase MiaA [Bifidobacteriaceae bacterium]
SGLYVRAAIDKIDFPGTDPAVRAHWAHLASERGPGALHAELRVRDPVAADRISSGNTRRLVRALEVIDLTGRPFSASLPSFDYWRPTRQIGVSADPEALDRVIGQRAADMIARGLVREVYELERLGLRQGRTASRAIGYAQALAVIDGRISETEATDQIALATRQLARRQRKWFRRDPRIAWIDGGRGALDAAVGVLRAQGVPL